MAKHESILNYSEAEEVASDLARGWQGLTGSAEVPSIEMLADIVQRMMRKADEAVRRRAEADHDA